MIAKINEKQQIVIEKSSLHVGSDIISAVLDV